LNAKTTRRGAIKSRRRVKIGSAATSRAHEQNRGRWPEATEGVYMMDTGRSSAVGADLAWCVSPALSLPSAFSRSLLCTSAGLVGHRLDGVPRTASPPAG